MRVARIRQLCSCPSPTTSDASDAAFTFGLSLLTSAPMVMFPGAFSRLSQSLHNAASALLVAGLVSLTSPAQAQSVEDKAAADALFDAARQALLQKDYDTACARFSESQKLDPAVGTLLNLGLCYKQAGRTASAWTTYREAAALSRSLGQEQREELARKEAKDLEARLVRLIVEVSDQAKAVPDLEISRNGKPLARQMWGIPLAIDPGEVTIVAVAEGYAETTASIDANDEGKTVTFRLPELKRQEGAVPAAVVEDSSQPPPSEASSVPEDAGPSKKHSPWPWILGGAGVATVAAGTVFGILSQSEYKKSIGLCVDYPETPCYEDEYYEWDQAQANNQAYAETAALGWVVGGAAIVGAAVWLVLDRRGSDESALKINALNHASTWGLSAEGTF